MRKKINTQLSLTTMHSCERTPSEWTIIEVTMQQLKADNNKKNAIRCDVIENRHRTHTSRNTQKRGGRKRNKQKKSDSIYVCSMCCIFYSLSSCFHFFLEAKTKNYNIIHGFSVGCCRSCHCWSALREGIHAANLFATQSSEIEKFVAKRGWSNNNNNNDVDVDAKKGWIPFTHAYFMQFTVRVRARVCVCESRNIWHKTDANAFFRWISTKIFFAA